MKSARADAGACEIARAQGIQGRESYFTLHRIPRALDPSRSSRHRLIPAKPKWDGVPSVGYRPGWSLVVRELSQGGPARGAGAHLSLSLGFPFRHGPSHAPQAAPSLLAPTLNMASGTNLGDSLPERQSPRRGHEGRQKPALFPAISRQSFPPAPRIADRVVSPWHLLRVRGIVTIVVPRFGCSRAVLDAKGASILPARRGDSRGAGFDRDRQSVRMGLGEPSPST